MRTAAVAGIAFGKERAHCWAPERSAQPVAKFPSAAGDRHSKNPSDRDMDQNCGAGSAPALGQSARLQHEVTLARDPSADAVGLAAADHRYYDCQQPKRMNAPKPATAYSAID